MQPKTHAEKDETKKSRQENLQLHIKAKTKNAQTRATPMLVICRPIRFLLVE